MLFALLIFGLLIFGLLVLGWLIQVGHERAGGIEEPGQRRLVVIAGIGAGQVALHVLDGAGQHPKAVLEGVELRASDDDLALVQPPFRGAASGLVVALAAAPATVQRRSPGSGPGRYRALAPFAAGHPGETSRAGIRHGDEITAAQGAPGGLQAR